MSCCKMALINSRRGQLKLSFGMIFSIILIVMFISFGTYVTMKLLDFQCSIKAKSFESKLQEDIDKMWGSSQGSEIVTYSVPSGVERVCIADPTLKQVGKNRIEHAEFDELGIYDFNMFYYPTGSACGSDGTTLEHIDFLNMMQQENPICLDVINGKVDVFLKIDYEENLVTISK